MSPVEFNAMVAAYSAYYGPMLELWRVIFFACSVIVGLLIFISLIIQRGLSAYL